MAETLALPSSEISVDQLSRIVGSVLGNAGITSVHDLIRWFEDGRRELLDNPEEAAKQLGTTKQMMSTVLASRAFRRAYYEYIFFKKFNPSVIASGLGLLAADFTSPDTSPKNRLAIMKAINEIAGIAQVQKVEHEVTAKTVSVEVKINATPDDFVTTRVAGAALEAGEGAPELGDGVHDSARASADEIAEAAFQEVN